MTECGCGSAPDASSVKSAESTRHALPAQPSRDRLADVHRQRPGVGHRPVQGRDRRRLPGAQCTPAKPARRVAAPDHRRAGGMGPRPSRDPGRALRRFDTPVQVRNKERPDPEAEASPRKAGGPAGKAELERTIADLTPFIGKRLDDPMIGGYLSQHLKTHYTQRHIARSYGSPKIGARLTAILRSAQ